MLVEFVSNFNQESSVLHKTSDEEWWLVFVFQMRILQVLGDLSLLSASSFPPASNNHDVGAEF